MAGDQCRTVEPDSPTPFKRSSPQTMKLQQAARAASAIVEAGL